MTNFEMRLELFLNTIQLFSEDVPLEFLMRSLGFKNVEDLLKWLVELELENFIVTEDADKLVITISLKDELQRMLGMDKNSSNNKPTVPFSEPIVIPFYHGNYLIREDRETLKTLEKYLGHPIPKVKEKIAWTKLGYLEENYKITGLLLSNIGLTNMPDIITKFSNLRTLDLSGNRLEEFPQTLCNIRSLQALSLQFNQINFLPECIKKFRNLNKLFLDSNELRAIPEGIGYLNKLEVITAGNNKIETLDDKIGKLKLKKLFLASNSIKEFPIGISKIKSLVDLNLGDNYIVNIPKQVKNMKSLRELYLMGNYIENFDFLTSIPNLEALDLSNNNIQEIPSSIKKMKNIKYLNLKFNPKLDNNAKEIGGTTIGQKEKNLKELRDFIMSF